MKPPNAPRRIALVDVNSFYCSAAKVFRPDLIYTPTCVLANNDGIIVARDALIKSLGIPMAVPWHEIKHLARQHGIIAFSSNYTLYGDISRRFMSVLVSLCRPKTRRFTASTSPSRTLRRSRAWTSPPPATQLRTE
jgi:nucleotidyltransferase/DNA polymerase involved in DNA repair